MIKYSYSSIYNMRPGELYGMGKESLNISNPNPVTYKEFLDILVKNSNIKFEDDTEWINGTNDFVQNPEWTRYIGQPMFFLVDISYEEVKDDLPKV